MEEQNVSLAKVDRIREVMQGYKEGFITIDCALQVIEYILRGDFKL